MTLVDRRGPLQGATAATTALLQYEIDTAADRVAANNRPRGCRARLAAVQAGLGKPGGESAIPGHPVRLQTRLLALPGGVAAGCGQGWRTNARPRNAIGLHTAYLTRQALQARYGIRRGAALLSFDTLSVDPLKLAAGFLRRALANGAQLFAPVTVEEVELRS